MFYKKVLILSLLIPLITQAETVIQASTLSCAMPTLLTGSTIIELDVDLNITGLCELIIPGPTFGVGDTVTFRPAASSMINIQSDVILNDIGIITVENPGIWDVSSFDQTTQRFIFENVTINMAPGGSILADGVTFQLNGTSQIITQAVTMPT